MSPNLRLIICNEHAEQKSHPPAELSIAQSPAEVAEDLAESGESERTGGYRFLPALVGLFLAMFFQILAHEVYGASDVQDAPWVDAVSWGLVAAGAVISLMQFIKDCIACSIIHAFNLHVLASKVCSGCS